MQVVSKDLLFNLFLAYIFAFSLLSKCRTLDLLGQDFLVLAKLIHCLGTIIHASSGLSVSKTVSFYDCPILKILLLGYAKNIIYILYIYIFSLLYFHFIIFNRIATYALCYVTNFSLFCNVRNFVSFSTL